jgi:uroporphyrinogen III methyltransferase/synthase
MTSPRTLAGRRIVVTRRPEQAGRLVGLLQDRGAEVLEVPATAIGPPDDPGPLDRALDDLGRFDWVVFTSANAVTAVRDRLAARGRPLRLGESGLRLASVGPATTRALGEAFPDDAVALEPESEFRAAGLVRAFAAAGCRGAALFVPASSRAREELPSGLRDLGAEVTVVAAYAPVEPPGLAPAVSGCLDEGFDAATFAAPSAVEAFAAAAPGGVKGRPAVVIGPTTEVAARKAGFRVLATAAPSTAEGLVAALERVLGPSPPVGS